MSLVQVMDYDEEQWNAYDRERQDACFIQWIRKARPLGFKYVSVRLTPDPLFGEKAEPYIVRTDPVGGDAIQPYTVSIRVSVKIAADVYEAAGISERLSLIKKAREEALRYTGGLPGFKWAVECGERTLDHG